MPRRRRDILAFESLIRSPDSCAHRLTTFVTLCYSMRFVVRPTSFLMQNYNKLPRFVLLCVVYFEFLTSTIKYGSDKLLYTVHVM